MSPDDNRHGTYAGANAHWVEGTPTCEPCQRAATRYTKARRLGEIRGHERTIPNRGSVRRIRALQRIGWSMDSIAEAIGWSGGRGSLSCILIRDRITVSLAERIAEVYEAKSGTPGPSTRARNYGIRNRWPAPLDWDDIDADDKPRREPGRASYSPAELVSEWEHLRRGGESIHQAAAQLGVSVKAIEKAIERDRQGAAA